MAARNAAVTAPVYLADKPRQAALTALASQRLDPSLESEMAMLAIAGAQRGVKRVISTGSPQVEAAVRMYNLVVTAGSDRLLRVWRASDGALLGEVRTRSPLSALADNPATTLLASSDRGGRVTLIDVSDPRRPSLRPLRSRLDTEGGLLTLAFPPSGVELLGVSAAGTLSRIDIVRDTASREPLEAITGMPPPDGGWAVAELEGEEIETLLLAAANGTVERVDLRSSQVELLAPPGLVPGRPTSLSSESYPEQVLVGATAGTLVSGEQYEDPIRQPGSSIGGILHDYYEGGIWIGDADGIAYQEESGVGIPKPAPAGGPVEALLESSGGFLAIHPHGVVSLVENESGLSLTDPEQSTPVVSFGPSGELLVAEGYDANHVEMLKTVQPGHAMIDGELVHSPDLRHYRPDPNWWPYAEDEEALYVNDAVMDERFVVAAGQDPMGEAVVLVWDAETGEPLQRLALGTGDVESTEPSIVSSVLLIPGKNLIAAYSTVQELVALWSTETWEQVDAVPIGPVGDLSLSPDEATIVAAGTAAEEGEFGESQQRSSLIFIDVESAEVTDEVATGDTHRVVHSPDGKRLATIGYDGMLRIRSGDGQRVLDRPIPLDGAPVALAWRPDGEVIAVALEDGGIVLVPAEGGGRPVPLPTDSHEGSFDLSWSADGAMLATTTSDYDEDGEGYDPGYPRIWTLSPARLERRMCQLTGGPISESEWESLVDEDLPPLPLCRAPDRHHAEDPPSAEHGPAVLAYQKGNRLFTADASGQTMPIGMVPEEGLPPTYAWAGEDLAWVAAGKAQILRAGASEPEWWPCPCAGAAWRDGALITITTDGSALLEFTPGRKQPRQIVPERPLDASRLLGGIGDWVILGRNATAPTSMELEMVDREGNVRHLRDDAGGNVEQLSSSPEGDRIAYAATPIAGPCASPPSIGILTPTPRDGVEISFPPLPEEEEIRKVRSVQLLPGKIGAAIGPLGCYEGEGGGPAAPSPPATRYELRGKRWVAIGGRSGDLQLAAGQVATLSAGGDLKLRREDSGEILVATEVDSMVARL